MENMFLLWHPFCINQVLTLPNVNYNLKYLRTIRTIRRYAYVILFLLRSFRAGPSCFSRSQFHHHFKDSFTPADLRQQFYTTFCAWHSVYSAKHFDLTDSSNKCPSSVPYNFKQLAQILCIFFLLFKVVVAVVVIVLKTAQICFLMHFKSRLGFCNLLLSSSALQEFNDVNALKDCNQQGVISADFSYLFRNVCGYVLNYFLLSQSSFYRQC